MSYDRSFTNFSNTLIVNNIENIISRAFDDAYISVLSIVEVLVKAKKSTLKELSSFVRVQMEQKSHTIDFSNNWDDYSDEELDYKAAKVLDTSVASSENCSENETDELFTNSGQNKPQFQGIRIFNEIPPSQMKSCFRIKIHEKEKYIHKQTACWLLTDSKTSLAADRIQRVQ